MNAFKQVLAGALLVLACAAPSAAETRKFPIGALFPMTGPQAFYGRVMSRGAKMAIDHLNAQGGVAGYTFRLVITDFKNVNAGLAVSGMKKTILMDRSPFVLASFSAVILAVQPLCAQHRVLMLNPGAYSPHLMNRPYLYSTKYIQTQMIPPMIRYLWENGARKLALIYISNPAGVVPAEEVITPMWTGMGGAIVASAPHPPGLTNFTDYLSRIKAREPDAIYDISTGQDQAYVIKDAREMGITVPITVPDWAQDYYDIAGETSENVFIPGDYFDYDNPDPETRRFIDAYEEKWHETPEIFAANYYDTVYNLLSELIRRVSAAGGTPLDGEQLEKAIWINPEFKTIYGGTMRLNRNGTCANKPMGIFKIVNGKKTLIKKVTVE
jgi:branched-chain amino acid transport system substrate-binding protein